MVQRKVLVVEEEASIRNLLYALLDRLGWFSDAATSGQQALAKISRQSFDAVLLDLRYSDLAPERVAPGILEIRPTLVGRVLVITGEVTAQDTMSLIEGRCLHSGPRHNLVHKLWNKLWGRSRTSTPRLTLFSTMDSK
jgi:DNA-binding NtrC family response regulator